MSGDVKPIRTKKDYEAALVEVERLWGAKRGTAKGDRLDVIATLIDAYEAEHLPIERLGIPAEILIRPTRKQRAA